MTQPGAALAFAEDVIARYGQPLVGGADDYVRVALSQQELAQLYDCAPSTVAWYLRRLGHAVVSRRRGLVFDRGAVERELQKAAAPRVAPRTASVERELARNFGQSTADGTRVEVTASLQELASHLGINRSTAHRHVAALQSAGLAERRGRRLYLVNKEPTVNDAQQSPTPMAGTGVSAEQVLQVLDKVADTLGAVVDLAVALLGPKVATDDVADPRIVSAQTAGLRAAAVADRARGSSLVPLIDMTDGEITSDQSPPRVAESRQLRAEEPRTDGGQDWTAVDLPVLLAPLLDECVRQDLPGVTDERRVLESLAPYDAEQVAAAARQMAADLRGGAPMRSPIAILVRKADEANPYYFRAKAEPTAPPTPPPLVEEAAPIDEEALAAVAALDPQAMADLDEEVTTRVQRLLGPAAASRALASEATLDHWRPIVWRARQEQREA